MTKYFYRVKLCASRDFSMGVFSVRSMADLRNLHYSFKSVLIGTVCVFIYTARLLIRPLWTIVTCFTIPIKYGSMVEEKISPSERLKADDK